MLVAVPRPATAINPLLCCRRLSRPYLLRAISMHRPARRPRCMPGLWILAAQRAWPTNPLSVAAPPSRVQSVGPWDGLSAAPVSRLPRLVVARCIGERNHHRFEVRGGPRVLFVAEWYMRLASARATRLKARDAPAACWASGGRAHRRLLLSRSSSPAAGHSETTRPSESIDRERLYSLFLLMTYKA
jgi:hypothetical protein